MHTLEGGPPRRKVQSCQFYRKVWHSHPACVLKHLHGQKAQATYPDSIGWTAFTLVELLIVIAIIAVLATLLIPVVKDMLKKSQAVACASNLRQIGGLTGIYAIDHDDRFPPAWTGNGMWLDILIAETQYGGNLTKARAAMSARRGFWRCPIRLKTDDEYSAIFDKNNGLYTANDHWWYNYGINYVGLTPVVNGLPAPIRRVAVGKPSQCIYVADADIDDGLCPWLIHSGWASAFPSARHQGKGNVLWVDGHVSAESLSWLTSSANAKYWQP